MHEPKLHELLDACRPGGRDLELPEFAELAHCIAADPQMRRRFDASQAFDRAVRETFDDVPVPAGLADRLLAAASRAAVDDAANTLEPVVLASRRRMPGWKDAVEAVAPCAVIAMFAVAIIAAVFFSSPPAISIDRLAERADNWRDQIDHDQWNESLKTAPREEFPPGSTASISPWRWQRMQTSNADVVVYYGGPPGAMLFVERSKAKVIGLTSAPKLLSSTGGWTIGAWRQGDLTYVLVVEGDRRRYESFFKTPAAA